ncbi:peptidoglycan-binding domain-containing protein [Pseudonocardia zijingensis]|uniref:Peptidoglycan binding-like domain-containing protein n=1 Tax=Pseudonocardia zijingensis TaxID=153376 RepID=A0ABP3YR03_9PSEU
MSWKVADSLDQLRAQLNEHAPDRSTASDGGIGDEDHQNRSSDHNPWWSLAGQHYVTARDFTHDPGGGLDCHELADALRAGRDQRVKYVIWNERIMAGAGGPAPWQWRDYNGPNPHTRHLHLSVVPDARALSRIPWLLPGLTSAPSRIVGVLRRGSRGPEVGELQRVLNAWYPHDVALQVDDVFGEATEDAVKLAQQRAGLVVDGVVGPRTRALLNL